MDFVEQLKSSVDIVSVDRANTCGCGSSGANRYMGLCPFHNEKTPRSPSTSVHQFYKCFSAAAPAATSSSSCMENRGRQLLRSPQVALAERYGIPMPKRSQYADDDSQLRGALLQMHELAQENFRANLQSPAGEAARAYLAKRGVAPETVEHFGLGYSDRSGRALVRLFEQRGFPAGADGAVGPGRQAAGWQLLRSFPQPPDVSDPQRIGQDHRLRRPRAVRRRRAEVFELARNADLQEEPRALQPASRQGGDPQGGPRRSWWKATWTRSA